MPVERRNAVEAALAALNRRARSVAELRSWLAERDFSAVDVDEAIATLRQAGELDDARYARLFAEDKRHLSGWGGERIAQALIERGVDRALAEETAGDETSAEQLERAVELLRRRGPAPPDDRERDRALGFLTRRGYSYELAYEAIRVLDRAA
jgi:regulatory protein